MNVRLPDAISAPPGAWRMRVFVALLLVSAGLALSGCDKCGDWFSRGSTKSCQDQSEVK